MPATSGEVNKSSAATQLSADELEAKLVQKLESELANMLSCCEDGKFYKKDKFQHLEQAVKVAHQIRSLKKTLV